MGYTFISYSRRQLYFAESVALNLQRAGLDVWFDLQKLTPGVDWASALKDGYSNCSQLILIASHFAIQSPYVRIEWETALANGREVIIVLSEAVVLPETLRGCAVYDARADFDRTIQSLIAYLRGEEPARHDPVPAAGKYSYSLSMPVDIRLTLFAMVMPTLTTWIATITISPTIMDFGDYLNFIADYMPGLPAQKILFYLVGLLLGGYLALVQFPIRAFWQHDIQYEELKDIRWNLLWIQIVACIFVLLATVFVPGSDGQTVNPFGYLILLCPLISAYWSFWTLPRSPDILRWLPSGEADQDLREAVQGKLSADMQRPLQEGKAVSAKAMIKFAIHHHPADAYNARFIVSILRSEGCQSAPREEANTHLVIVSNRTSKQWLLDLDETHSGQVIHILSTNINTPPDIQPALQTQWVDFRTGRVKTLQALAAHLRDKDSAAVHYGMQISPTGFDTVNGFPRRVRFVLGSCYLILFLLPLVMVMLPLKIDERLAFGLFAIPGLAMVLYVDALVMRKVSLPLPVQKWLGHRAAWFASPAPAAPDAIGNSDRKYVYKLTDWVPRS